LMYHGPDWPNKKTAVGFRVTTTLYSDKKQVYKNTEILDVDKADTILSSYGGWDYTE